MALIRIATVVEGQGEVQAVPLLLRRIMSEINPAVALDVPQPWRVGRETLINSGGIESVVNKVAAMHGSGTTILVLFDADDDCPATLAPALVDRALAARADVSTKVVLAMREFEAWFLAAAPSLAGLHALSDSLERPPDPEGPRGCKEWLSRNRTDSRRYKPTADQTKLTANFDLSMARAHAPSFDKLWRDLEKVVSSGY